MAKRVWPKGTSVRLKTNQGPMYSFEADDCPYFFSVWDVDVPGKRPMRLIVCTSMMIRPFDSLIINDSPDRRRLTPEQREWLLRKGREVMNALAKAHKGWKF